jgi:hypothetical protein
MLANTRQTRDCLTISYRNVVKCSKAPAESPEHRNVKWWLACFCWDHALNFHTEATWTGGSGRADFIVEEWAVCFEILETEEAKTFEKKNYPLCTIPIRTTSDLIELHAALRELYDTAGGAADFYRKLYKGRL